MDLLITSNNIYTYKHTHPFPETLLKPQLWLHGKVPTLGFCSIAKGYTVQSLYAF